MEFWKEIRNCDTPDIKNFINIPQHYYVTDGLSVLSVVN